MCLIAFAYQCHPRYRLIMVANRDEFYARPTKPAHLWKDGSEIIAGLDLEAGGTWMGLQKSGRLAAVTNFREGMREANPTALSRGQLATDFLSGDITPWQYAEQLQQIGQAYNGFNLLVADADSLVYCSNRADAISNLQPGVYSLSNHLLDTPWPKSVHAKESVSKLLEQDVINHEDLIACLRRSEPYPDEQLPTTGIGQAMERVLSPPFIATAEYGTRCTTGVLWSRDGTLEIVEANYSEGGVPGIKRVFRQQAR